VTFVKEFSWGNFEDKFVDEMADWIGNRRVLEVFAGNGLLAKKLRDRGIDITPTTLFQSHDQHEKGMHCEVEELSAIQAVHKYAADMDILLMAWPVPTEAASAASVEWGEDKPIFFIGEVTDLSINQLGGCASDSFFEMTKVTQTFSSYRQGRSGIEHACIRQVLPEAREILSRAVEAFTAQMRAL
jgi:hypothetical protein